MSGDAARIRKIADKNNFPPRVLAVALCGHMRSQSASAGFLLTYMPTKRKSESHSGRQPQLSFEQFIQEAAHFAPKGEERVEPLNELVTFSVEVTLHPVKWFALAAGTARSGQVIGKAISECVDRGYTPAQYAEDWGGFATTENNGGAK